jgi:hypothetical protein
MAVAMHDQGEDAINGRAESDGKSPDSPFTT